MIAYRNFTDLTELVEYIKTHAYVMYQGPLNHRPVTVEVVRFTIDNRDISKSKCTLYARENGQLPIKLVEHLDRFKTTEAPRVEAKQ